VCVCVPCMGCTAARPASRSTDGVRPQSMMSIDTGRPVHWHLKKRARLPPRQVDLAELNLGRAERCAAEDNAPPT
jgi:hypothetical protein